MSRFFVFILSCSVLYFSIHRYEHAQFFPFSTYANYDVVGEGAGEGYTVNVPWNKVLAFLDISLPFFYQRISTKEAVISLFIIFS